MKELREIKSQTPCSSEALSCASPPLFPIQTPVPVCTACRSYTDPAAAATCTAMDRSWDTLSSCCQQEPTGTGWEQTPSHSPPCQSHPRAAQGVGTGLQESYQFVWCNQQHCHVHTDTNAQISAEFDGWADGRQVIKSIWLENHCHFQLKITPANSYHNFVLFRAKLGYQSKWWSSFLGRSCKILSNWTLKAVWQRVFSLFFFLMHQVL